MSSNTCRALNSPYVTLVFTVVTDVAMGTTKQYSVELSMQQFQVTISNIILQIIGTISHRISLLN